MVIEMDAMTSIRPVAQPRHRAVVKDDIVRVDEVTHMVLQAGRTAGFVWKAGDVYVALEGSTLATACEIGQSLVWDVAIELVKRAERGRPAEEP